MHFQRAQLTMQILRFFQTRALCQKQVHYQYNLKRVFRNTIELPIPWMRKINTMDILITRYFLNIKFGELSLINVALKTLMQRMVAKLVGRKQAETVKSNRFKTIYKCVLLYF